MRRKRRMRTRRSRGMSVSLRMSVRASARCLRDRPRRHWLGYSARTGGSSINCPAGKSIHSFGYSDWVFFLVGWLDQVPFGNQSITKRLEEGGKCGWLGIEKVDEEVIILIFSRRERKKERKKGKVDEIFFSSTAVLRFLHSPLVFFSFLPSGWITASVFRGFLMWCCFFMEMEIG